MLAAVFLTVLVRTRPYAHCKRQIPSFLLFFPPNHNIKPLPSQFANSHATSAPHIPCFTCRLIPQWLSSEFQGWWEETFQARVAGINPFWRHNALPSITLSKRCFASQRRITSLSHRIHHGRYNFTYVHAPFCHPFVAHDVLTQTNVIPWKGNPFGNNGTKFLFDESGFASYGSISSFSIWIELHLSVLSHDDNSNPFFRQIHEIGISWSLFLME